MIYCGGRTMWFKKLKPEWTSSRSPLSRVPGTRQGREPGRTSGQHLPCFLGMLFPGTRLPGSQPSLSAGHHRLHSPSCQVESVSMNYKIVGFERALKDAWTIKRRPPWWAVGWRKRGNAWGKKWQQARPRRANTTRQWRSAEWDWVPRPLRQRTGGDRASRLRTQSRTETSALPGWKSVGEQTAC